MTTTTTITSTTIMILTTRFMGEASGFDVKEVVMAEWAGLVSSLETVS